jgi:hypothetical protein
MKIRKEYCILGIVIVACVAYLALYNKDRTRYTLPSPPPIDKDALSSVTITRSNATLRLEKRGNTWYIKPGGYPADKDRVNAVLEAFRGLTLTALVSESGSYSRYGLDNAGKITVNAWAGENMVRSVDIGDTASTRQHTFVKLPGDGNVYHARGNLKNLFEKSSDDLRDRRVLSFSQSDIRRIRITAGGDVRELVRQEAVTGEEKPGPQGKGESSGAPAKALPWNDTSGAAVDEKLVQRLLTICADMRCSAFIEGGKEVPTKPLFRIEMEGTQTRVLTLFPGKDEGAKEYPAASSGCNYPFLLPSHTVDELRTIVTSLRSR